MGMTEKPPIELATGSTMTGDADLAKQLGVLVHRVMMGSLVFGLVHRGSR
jgi:hypothetical protein